MALAKVRSPLSDEELLRLAVEEYEELRRAELRTQVSSRFLGYKTARVRAAVTEIRRLCRRLGINLRPPAKPREKRVDPRRDAGRKFKKRAADRGELACYACGFHPPRRIAMRIMHAHHIVPVAAGGPNDESNLVLLCANCHGAAHCVYHRFSVKEWNGPTTKAELLSLMRTQ